MEMERVLAYLEASPTVRLLRADQGAYVLFFLRQTLKLTGEDSAISMSHDDLLHQLSIFQENLQNDGYDVLSGTPDRYLREWSDAGWLRRFLPADSSGPSYQLTRYAEDAIQFVDAGLSRQHRMVGTESRLRLVIDTLTDLVRGSSADPGRRLQSLLAERERSDREIEAIRGGAPVDTYHLAQVRERFNTAVDLLKTLQGDFRAVEDRFEEIAREVTRSAFDLERGRGEILAGALDAEDLVKQQDEGVSFDAFVSFLFSPQAQTRLRETISEVLSLEALANDRGGIEHIRTMVPNLLAEAENVLRQTGRLSQTLRRLLDSESTGHRRRTAEVLKDIRTLAAKLKQSGDATNEPVPQPIGLQVQTSSGVDSPFARPFWTPAETFDIAPQVHEVDLETVQRQARKLAGMQRLQWDRMRDLIQRLTDSLPTVALSQLLRHRPPQVGVIELVGWLQIAHEDGHRIDRDSMETITVTTKDPVSERSSTVRVRVPLVTFYRTRQAKNETIRKGKPR
ncbi:DUF3375 family protein [Roseimaritima ulvae]|uniref:DUF3375 domain-containing protein n=1 Tax=Roseimaritima ulvae TaxID=980254 RepID=A0A5B9R8U2_9BACT|nr:DUF3375 family protein [Roseimaritima ulvae]QEG43103.1 hypothetical protein UC8_51470 [Roseimaritima ulvae]